MTTILFFIVSGVFGTFAGSLQPTGQQASLSVSVEPLKPSLTLREPVLATMLIQNTLEFPVFFDLGFDNQENLELVVVRGGETTSTKRHWEWWEKFGAMGRHRLLPGERFSRVLILNDWFQFDQVGDYQVELRFATQAHSDTGSPATPLPARMTIQIQSFDAIRLTRRCRKLSEEALGSLARPAAEAARALAVVQDPVAVPYLATVLKSSSFGRGIALRALAGIANAEAVEVLIGGLKNSSEDVRLMARDQLGRLAKRSEDPALRSRISKALAKKP